MKPTANASDSNLLIIGQFQGRHSDTAKELFKDTQRLFGFSPFQAHAVAARLCIDLGRLQHASAEIKVGKLTGKDNLRTVSESAKSKMPDSWALAIAYCGMQLDKLRKDGMEIPAENGLSFNANILSFVNEAALKVKTRLETQNAPIVKESEVTA